MQELPYAGMCVEALLFYHCDDLLSCLHDESEVLMSERTVNGMHVHAKEIW